MRSEIDALDGRECDVLLADGGIVAAGVAEAAAERGLRVVLAAPGDPAHSAAGPSSCLLAATLPAIEAVGPAATSGIDPGWSLAVRERLLRAAPHLVRPLPLWLHGAGDVLARLCEFQASVVDSTLPEPSVVPTDVSRRPRGEVLEVWEARVDAPRLAVALLRRAVELGATVVGDCAVASLDGSRVEVVGSRGTRARLSAAVLEPAPGDAATGFSTRTCTRAPVFEDSGRIQVRDHGTARRLVAWIRWPGHGTVREVFEHLTPSATGLLATPHAWSLGPALCRLATRFGGDATPRPWRSGFHMLPGGAGPHEPLDDLWQRHGGEAVEIRAAASSRGESVLDAEIRHAIDHLGARTWEQCTTRLGAAALTDSATSRATFESALARTRTSPTKSH